MIHYTIEGKGLPLVLLHGFPNNSEAWNQIVPELSEQFRVILPDLPGAGKSQLPKHPLTLEYMARAVKEVLDYENISDTVIAGHSMGGYTALEFASLFPERVKGVILIHALASDDKEAKKENRRKAIALMQKGEAEKEMFLKGMSQNLFSGVYARNHPESLKQIVANGMALSVEALSAFYTAIMLRTDKSAFLEQATFPVQWIVGDEDNATPMVDALAQCALAPINQIVLYSPCGHMSFMEMPQRLIRDIAGFVRFCNL